MGSSARNPQLVHFADCTLDLQTAELRRNGTKLILQDQPFQILTMLLENPGQLVTREELTKKLWPNGTFVDFDQSLNKAVARLREALGCNADNPRFIETLPRRGYRWIGQIQRSEVIGGTGQKTLDADNIGLHRAIWRRRARLLIPATVLLIAVTVIADFYHKSKHRSRLTDKDTIILADFTNTTGDSVFDDTLKEALSVQLQQSPFLDRLSDRKVTDTLKLIGKSAGERLSPELAQQVCVRNGGKAVFIGTIASLGKEYVIALKAITCDAGDVLADEQVQAKNKEGVLSALDTAAVSLRAKLGQSLIAVNSHTAPLEEVATPSLEALQAYSLGQRTTLERGWTAGIPFFMRSVELDPHFARAYLAIAGSYANLGQMEHAAEYSRKAYELRATASEAERFAIDALYYAFVTGELEKTAEVCEVWRQIYPRSATAVTNLAAAEASLGRHEEALEHGHEALQMEPQGQNHYLGVGAELVRLDRFEEAEALYNEADRRKLDREPFADARYLLAFLRGDPERMSTVLATAIGKPGMEHRVLALQAETEAWYGRFESARDFARRAINSAVRNDGKEDAAIYEGVAALREAEIGNTERARANIKSAAKKSANRNARSIEAFVLARTGDTIDAEKMAAELDAKFSHDTLVQKYWLPSIRAAIRLRRKEPRQALELLETSTSVELSAAVRTPLIPAYLRGHAYLMLHDGYGAAKEFRKLIVHRGLVANSQLGVLSRLELARALWLQGDLAASRTEYQELLHIWKDVDPDSPILVRAKSEYEKLR